MTTTVRTNAKVLPGNRVEVYVPQFAEGETVEVVVARTGAPSAAGGVLNFLDSLPAGPRSFVNWEEFERHFEQERDDWDR